MQVSFFWDNQPISKLELLTLRSFCNYSNDVSIFTYNTKIFKDFNQSIRIVDANEIISEDLKFYYAGNGNCPNSSIVGFSDIFRYKLLHQVGGWYCDMDTACIEQVDDIDSINEIVVRPHREFDYISNICKFPKGHPVLMDLYDTTVSKVTRQNNNWNLPLQIFRDAIIKYQLTSHCAAQEHFGDDSFLTDIKPLLYEKYYNLKASNRKIIHWCSSAIKTGRWSANHFYNTNNPLPGTMLSYLYNKYSI